jgi:DNA-directed RNA polymerase specialized sigma24 family protein
MATWKRGRSGRPPADEYEIEDMTKRELSADQRAAIGAAKRAQRKFERAHATYERTLHDRTLAIRGALDAGVSYGELAAALGLHRGTVQAAMLRERRR